MRDRASGQKRGKDRAAASSSASLHPRRTWAKCRSCSCREWAPDESGTQRRPCTPLTRRERRSKRRKMEKRSRRGVKPSESCRSPQRELESRFHPVPFRSTSRDCLLRIEPVPRWCSGSWSDTSTCSQLHIPYFHKLAGFIVSILLHVIL